MDDKSVAAHVQTLAYEAGSDALSQRARSARSELKTVHRDLPDLVENSAKYLSMAGIDVGASRALSHRLADSLVREIGETGKPELAPLDLNNISRAAMRSVLVQEAAGHEFERRGVQADPLRAFMNDKSPNQGDRAIAVLARQGADIEPVLEAMDGRDIRHMTTGSYDKVNPKHAEALGRILEVPSTKIGENAPRLEQAAQRPPVMVSPRRAPAAPVRQATFGRRIAAQHQLAAAGMSH